VEAAGKRGASVTTTLTVHEGQATGRPPPQNIDAERSLLGGILLDGKMLDQIALIISAADFYRPANRKVFEAMCAVAEDGEAVERVTVKERLISTQQIGHVGGEDYLDLLDKIVPTAANLEYYARIIRDKSQLRSLIETLTGLARLAYEDHGSVSDFIGEIEKRVFALRREENGQGFRTARDIVTQEMVKLTRLQAGDIVEDGIKTGLEDYDHVTGGLKPGQLIVVAARPSMGKSALVLQWALHMARSTGGSAALFSLEMGDDELGQRMLTNRARVRGAKMRNAGFDDSEWERLMVAADEISNTHFFIDDTLHTSIGEIRAKARRKAQEARDAGHPLRLIAIDYLQLAGEFGEYREQEISAISRGLKALAKELEVPVVALSQLNRKCEMRPDKRPFLSDLRDSGSIEQDADNVTFIYRDDFYDKNSQKPGVAELIIGKHRGGALATVEVAFIGESVLFQNLGPGAQPAQRSLYDGPPPHTNEDAP
jgi:replicative DNA helicase